MNARQLLALQLGELMIANAEAAALNEALAAKVASLEKRLAPESAKVEAAE